MRKTAVLVSFLALFTTHLAADPAPEVEVLDTAAAPFAINAVKVDFADGTKRLTIRTRVSASSEVRGAMLRIAIVTKDGACRIKAAFRRDLPPGSDEWPVVLPRIESSDRVFVSPDVTPARNAAEESRRTYDDLLANAFDKRGMKPMTGGCRNTCRYFQVACSDTCNQSELGSCVDCAPLLADECSCMVCQCMPSPVDCDDTPCS